MQIICDSREKQNHHILMYFKKHNIPYIIQKMDVADYTVDGFDGGSVVIDRKQNLEELSRNMMNKTDRSRFWKEVRRAHNYNTKMIVLCEHGNGIRCIEDVKNWKSNFSGVHGRVLMERIYQCHISYGVEFLFCEKWQTARKILELLGVGYE